MSRPSPPTREPRARADTLALLAVALRPPKDRRELAMCLEELRRRLPGGQETRHLTKAIAGLAKLDRPEKEYHRVFLGPTRPVAAPFESVYLDRVVFGPTAQGFLRELRDAGLEPVREFALPPDHVAIQLEFLAHLETRAWDARAAGRFDDSAMGSGRARRFVEEHLARWLPLFSARLEAGAPGSPYTALVRATVEYLGLRSTPRKLAGGPP